jgi:hypothetical protein
MFKVAVSVLCDDTHASGTFLYIVPIDILTVVPRKIESSNKTSSLNRNTFQTTMYAYTCAVAIAPNADVLKGCNPDIILLEEN